MNFNKVEQVILNGLIEEIAQLVNAGENTGEENIAEIRSPVLLLQMAAAFVGKIYNEKNLTDLPVGDAKALLAMLQEVLTDVIVNCRPVAVALTDGSATSVPKKLSDDFARLEAEFSAAAAEIENINEKIKKRSAEIQNLEQELTNGIDKFNRLSGEEAELRNSLELYADASRRTLNSLPRALDATHEKLTKVESLLKEVDDELRKTLEEHQRGRDLMQRKRL